MKFFGEAPSPQPPTPQTQKPQPLILCLASVSPRRSPSAPPPQQHRRTSLRPAPRRLETPKAAEVVRYRVKPTKQLLVKPGCPGCPVKQLLVKPCETHQNKVLTQKNEPQALKRRRCRLATSFTSLKRLSNKNTRNIFQTSSAHAADCDAASFLSDGTKGIEEEERGSRRSETHSEPPSGHGNPAPLVNIPIPTKIGSKMGGEFTENPEMGSQNGFDNHSHLRIQQNP